MGKAASGFAGLSARVPRANAGHAALRPRPQGHAKSRLTRVAVTTKGLRAHGWSRRLGDDPILAMAEDERNLLGRPLVARLGFSGTVNSLFRRLTPGRILRELGGSLALQVSIFEARSWRAKLQATL